MTTRSTLPAWSNVDRDRLALLLGTSTLHEAAGQIGMLPIEIRNMTPGLRVAGPAFPVRCSPGNNVWIHRAIYRCAPRDVLVVDVGGKHDAGYWGEVMSCAASWRDVGGVVLDGGARDIGRLPELGVPVFARGACMRGTGKDTTALGSAGEPVRIGEVEVRAGDLIVCDDDGVICVPAEVVDDMLNAAVERAQREAEVMASLRAGASTLELYGLD